MDTPHQLAALRFETFAATVLEPAVFPESCPLGAAAYQCAEPIPYDLAVEQDYAPVDPGWRWGPAWSTAWLRLRGQVPSSWSGRRVALRFSCGTEATLWSDGVPRHGLDARHRTAPLLDPARGGEAVELHVEAACNGPLGVTTFWWDEAELAARWREPRPGRLERCELAVFDAKAWSLWQTYELARRLLLDLPAAAPRAAAVLEALEIATRRIDDRAPARSADAALAALTAVLRGGPSRSTTTCHAIGHAHIDTAWLWPLRETRRKCLRTFATALRLMERFEDFTFACTQPQQYAWVERDAPRLFAEIVDRVREGRWEPTGAMWVEPDGNVPSAESLARQLLHGIRWFDDRFGDDAPQRVLYLPDTFGFPHVLPQLMDQAGLDTFVTNKLAWNRTNRFPLATFRWRGLDGTEVLAHCLPGEDYNATLTPPELRRGERTLVEKGSAATVPTWLQPFGYGDGGGGPTGWMVHFARLARACDGLPEVRLSTVAAFRTALHGQHRRLRREGRDLPVWDGPLDLELHRGTYTTQAWLKRANHAAERDLRAAEWLGCATPAPADEAAGDPERLHEAWRLVLLNQFHDILPGSSIAEVYDEARRHMRSVTGSAGSIIDAGVRRWAAAVETRGVRRPALVLNETSWPQSAVVDVEGARCFAADVPALGAAVVERDDRPDLPPTRATTRTLSNGLITATVDDAGRLISLRRERDGREAAAGPLNELVLYEDLPRRWEAWDLDEEYEAKPIDDEDATVESIAVVEDGPLRAAIEVNRTLGSSSRVALRYELDIDAPCVVVRAKIDWHEDRRLLRALFPIDASARHVTCGVQNGYAHRPTHRNTSWEQARHEWCVHGWMDLSEPGFGAAVLSRAVYGQSGHDGTLGLSLLRSPLFPDPGADRGEHEIVYAIMVHDGDWGAAGVDRAAALLRAPLRAVTVPPERAGERPGRWAPVEIEADGAAGVEVMAMKRSEDGERIVLRVAETRGGRGRARVRWQVPAKQVASVDLLERPRDRPRVEHDRNETAFEIGPFQIVTLAARG